VLVAVSGSQGSGKSTTIDSLFHRSLDSSSRTRKTPIRVVARKSSRSIFAAWGVTLNEVNNDRDLTLKFQDEIIERKHQDEANMDSDGLVFTERTYADLFTYALVSLGNNNKNSDWLNEYYLKCIEYQQTYDSVYYLSAGKFNVKHDGVRGSNDHYSRMVDITMREYTEQMTHPSKLNIIQTPDLLQRAHIILNQSLSLNS